MCQKKGLRALQSIGEPEKIDMEGNEQSINCRNQIKFIPVIANGDIIDAESAVQMASGDTGCDGIMIGRGAIRNPWVFQEIKVDFVWSEYIYLKPTRKKGHLRTIYRTIQRRLSIRKTQYWKDQTNRKNIFIADWKMEKTFDAPFFEAKQLMRLNHISKIFFGSNT